MSRFPYKWNLSGGYPAADIEKHGLTVFGTFICGGGSTMGYKLAGFNHLGGVELDNPIADVYRVNHAPKYLFNEDIREFNKRTDLPQELFNLDILDGSPPCSTFSVTGLREKAWGKEKMFKEGQAKQILDDLVFEYCDTIIKLSPKVFILENVKGIILGNAKAYSKKIVEKMQAAGYTVQVFMLNAASMGIPQMRERVFFIGSRSELGFPKLQLSFNDSPIYFKQVCDYCDRSENLTPLYQRYWGIAKQGKPVGKFNTLKKMKLNDVAYTVTAQQASFSPISKRTLNKKELCLIGSFPLDYNFLSVDPNYLIGMSVPPVMTAQIAYQIYKQWFKNRE